MRIIIWMLLRCRYIFCSNHFNIYAWNICLLWWTFTTLSKENKTNEYTHHPPLSPPTATRSVSPRIFVCAAAILMLANPVMASLVSELSQATNQQLCKWECWYLAKFRLMYYLGWQEKEIPSPSYSDNIFINIVFKYIYYTEAPPPHIYYFFH